MTYMCEGRSFSRWRPLRRSRDLWPQPERRAERSARVVPSRRGRQVLSMCCAVGCVAAAAAAAAESAIGPNGVAIGWCGGGGGDGSVWTRGCSWCGWVWSAGRGEAVGARRGVGKEHAGETEAYGRVQWATRGSLACGAMADGHTPSRARRSANTRGSGLSMRACVGRGGVVMCGTCVYLSARGPVARQRSVLR